MCGIVGYAGKKEAAPILLEGLTKLEYRGYDSSGIAVLSRGGIQTEKSKGRLKNLKDKTNGGESVRGVIGIGHTRWATHGAPSDINSHPHTSPDGRFAVVHNGIIENYLDIKDFLTSQGFKFVSETDTEVIALLFEHYFSGDMPDTIRKVTNRLKGSYALGILFKETPDVFYAARHDSPLVVGIGEGENFIASDMPALLSRTRKFILLEDGETAAVTKDSVSVFNANGERVEREPFTADWSEEAASKGGYPHFMLKEINEQPEALKKTINSKLTENGFSLKSTGITDAELESVAKINIVGCGSAYHAGIIGKYFIEEVAKVPVETDLASEFRYRNPIIAKDTLTVIISQSGETADTLAALREAKRRGSKVFAIVNVVGSQIAREADAVMYTLAGPEISVATTKGYTTQVASLMVLGLCLAKVKDTLPESELTKLEKSLSEIPQLVRNAIDVLTPKIQYLSSIYHGLDHAFFIGRGLDYASAMEGSLKLKEISYIHAEAYAAGELKHGTISLIEEGSLVVSLATNPILLEKTLSNTKEVKTRGAKIIAITAASDESFSKEADHVLMLPDTSPLFMSLLSAAALQLFGYYMAAARGLDIDKPRNLAKSVTVE